MGLALPRGVAHGILLGGALASALPLLLFALALVTTQWHLAGGSPAPLPTKLSSVRRSATLPANHQSMTLHKISTWHMNL